MAKEKTITLPALGDNEFYCRMPEIITETLGSGYGKWDLDVLALATEHAPTVWGLFRYGVRQVGNDAATTAEKAKGADKATDSAKQAAIAKRIEAVVSGKHVFGHGGGARLDTYLIVLREMVVAELLSNVTGQKKGEADKLARADCEAAYMVAAEAIAKAGGHDADQVHMVMWPKIVANAESEAKRRDAAADNTAMHKGLADMIAAAVIDEKIAS